MQILSRPSQSQPRTSKRARLVVLLLPLSLAACGGGGDDSGLADHTLYTMSNAASGNEVYAFRRAADGTLTKLAVYPTGGNGLGSTEISAVTPQDGFDVLASQGSIQMSPDKRFLVAVNAGSSTITSFTIDKDGLLTRADVKPSGGLQPNAIGMSNSAVYVSNVGATSNSFASNITGFKLGSDGMLTPIGNSTRSLSTANAQPARVTFNSSGSLLAVTELSTNKISVFPVAVDGTLGTVATSASVGGGPFGASFLSTGPLLVTEAGTGSVSSYRVGTAGALTPISRSVPSGQIATCWTILGADEKVLYTANSGSGNLSSYSIAADGSLTLALGVASMLDGPSSAVIDGGVSEDGRYVYALESALGTVVALRIEANGSLTKVQSLSDSGLPRLGAEGLVVR